MLNVSYIYNHILLCYILCNSAKNTTHNIASLMLNRRIIDKSGEFDWRTKRFAHIPNRKCSPYILYIDSICCLSHPFMNQYGFTNRMWFIDRGVGVWCASVVDHRLCFCRILAGKPMDWSTFAVSGVLFWGFQDMLVNNLLRKKNTYINPSRI